MPASTSDISKLPSSQAETLEILYRDDYLVAVNKPSGLLVHRSEIDRHETRFALQILRDQLGQRVYPLHRLDKPTSGVLLFGLSSDIARAMAPQFEQQQIQKTYLAICRGHAPEQVHVDHALKEELDKYSDNKARQNNPAKEAQTDFHRLATIELDVAVDRYPRSRYCLVECRPHQGRKHQIRRHLKHISHPIIGDAKHGKGIHNRYFKQQLNAGRLLLHAHQLSFRHPISQQMIDCRAQLDSCWLELLERFDWLDSLPTEARAAQAQNSQTEQ